MALKTVAFSGWSKLVCRLAHCTKRLLAESRAGGLIAQHCDAHAPAVENKL